MGLLRKAALAVHADDANPLAPKGRVSGLLQRGLQIRKASLGRAKAAAPPAKDGAAGRIAGTGRKVAAPRILLQPDEAARQILEEARTLADSVELPAHLFATLRKRLSILNGAILLYDPARSEYAPWASRGFDQTTLHRMRIPLGANDSFNALANGQPLQITEPAQKAAFQRFFSSREFSSLGKILLSPFVFDETLIGVLLVTELRHPFANDALLLSCLKQVSGESAPLLQKARGFLMKWSQARAGRAPVTPEEQVARLLGSAGSQRKKFLLISLGLEAYLKEIASAHEDIDVFRLREDLRNFLDAFLADLGVAVALPAGVLLVCLQGIKREDADLFLHQLRVFLAQHFPGTGAGIKALRSRVWPDDGTDVRELISSFS